MTETFYSTINVWCNFALIHLIQNRIFIVTFANTEIRVLRVCVCVRVRKVIAGFFPTDWVPLCFWHDHTMRVYAHGWQHRRTEVCMHTYSGRRRRVWNYDLWEGKLYVCIIDIVVNFVYTHGKYTRVYLLIYIYRYTDL